MHTSDNLKKRNNELNMHAFVQIKAYIKELDLLKLEQTPFICGHSALIRCCFLFMLHEIE